MVRGATELSTVCLSHVPLHGAAHGLRMAPMGNLKLNGVTADADYQKSLDTFSKRHHLRLWKQGKEDAWLSAATEDIGYAVRRMHLTHATDPLIDNERAKVLNDLAFTGCVDSASLMARDSAEGADQQATFYRDRWKSGSFRMNECSDPRTTPGQASGSAPRGRIRAVQALVALRNDLIRTNPISLAYNTTRVLRQRQVSHGDGSLSASSLDRQQSKLVTKQQIQPRWIRPSAFNASERDASVTAAAGAVLTLVCDQLIDGLKSAVYLLWLAKEIPVAHNSGRDVESATTN